MILIIACGILSACTVPFKSKMVNPKTPRAAAKDFVDALTSGSMVELNQVTYKSQSMPTEKIMDIAKIRHVIGMNPKQFTYKTDPADKETIWVSFDDHQGNKDKWRLVFIKDASNVYQYAGSFSGTLMANATPKEAMKSYAEILTHSEDKYWFNDISEDKKPGSELIPSREEINLAKKYNFNKKTMSDFTIKNGNLGNDSGLYSMEVLQFKDNRSIHNVDYYFAYKDDGYYLKGSGGQLETSDKNNGNYQAKSPSQACIAFMDGLYKGVIKPTQLTEPNLAKQISSIAVNRKISKMKWGYEYNPDPKINNAFIVDFKSPTGGGKDVLEFVFKKNKAGIEQFDTNASGTFLDNMSPVRMAKSYIKVLMNKSNAYELKSLTYPSKRANFSNQDELNYVKKYHLQERKLSDFKIKSVQNKVTIQFKDSSGNVHSIYLSIEKWIDGYYVVSHQLN